jgi:uncharacterized damage-inducible protein DinB
MFLDAIVRLYDYQREVNNHVLEVAERLSEDELTSIIIKGQPSIRDTLFHMIEVVESHFAYWSYSSDQRTPAFTERSSNEFSGARNLKDYWVTVDAHVASCVASLSSDSDLERSYVRVFPDGGQNTRILWEMLLHVINHGTQHRSEVAMMLTKLGHSPGDMEIL